MFYNGLNGQTRTIVDATSGGTLMSKTAEGATSLLAKKVVGIHELDPFAALSAQVASLSHQVSTLTTQRIP